MSRIIKSVIIAIAFFIAMFIGHLMSSQMFGFEFNPNWLLSGGLAVLVGIGAYLADRNKKQ